MSDHLQFNHLQFTIGRFQMLFAFNHRTKDKRQKTKDKGQKTKDKGQRTEQRTKNQESQLNSEHRTRNTEHGTRNTERETRNTEHETRNVSTIIPSFKPKCYIHQAYHNRNFDQRTNNGRKCFSGVDTKNCNGNCNSQLKIITGCGK